MSLLTPTACFATIGESIHEKDLVLWDVPTELEIGVIPKRIYCNRRLVVPLSNAFAALIKSDEVKFLKTWDGCFNIRHSKGNLGSYSLHAWGLGMRIK